MESPSYFENLGRFLNTKIPQYTFDMGLNILIDLTHSKCPN